MPIVIKKSDIKTLWKDKLENGYIQKIVKKIYLDEDDSYVLDQLVIDYLMECTCDELVFDTSLL